MEDFKVIDNYLMIRLPNEIDHHKSVDISARQIVIYCQRRSAMWFLILRGQPLWTVRESV